MSELPPCEKDIYMNGDVVEVMENAGSEFVEHWVKFIARESAQPVDWHYVAGRVVVKTTGDVGIVREIMGQNLREYLAELRTRREELGF